MTTYDPTIIQQFVDRLYKKANRIISNCTLIGIVVGGGCGFALGSLQRGHTSQGMTLTAAMFGIGALLFGALGHSIGSARAFHLKLTAQTTLCQMQIEANTRQAAGHAHQKLAA